MDISYQMLSEETLCGFHGAAQSVSSHSLLLSECALHALQCQSFNGTLGGDNMNMLTHTYPHNHLREIELTLCNHHAGSPHYVWPDV